MSLHSVLLMGSKNIAVRMDLIRILDLVKRPGESYSDVIDRYLGHRTPLLEVVRQLREHPVEGRDNLTPTLRKIREDMNASAARRLKDLEALR